MKLGIAGAFALLIAGCPASTGHNAVIAGSYEAQQLECVDRATTKQEAIDCQCEVRKRYNRACPSGSTNGGGK
jgi:hypothetical protein